MDYGSYKKNVAQLFLFVFFFGLSFGGYYVLNGISSRGLVATISAVGEEGSYGWGADGVAGGDAGDGTNGGAGWIDMKDVGVDPDSGLILGTAWSSNFGWLQFGNLSGAPVTDDNPTEDATLDSDGVVTGWARFCNGSTDASDCSGPSRTDGWDGWVSLHGLNYGLELDSSDNRIKGFAWGGGQTDGNGSGWMYFNMDGTAVSNGMSCTPSKQAIRVGDSVTWTAYGVPAEYENSLAWYGEGFNGDESGTSVTVTYEYAGTYDASFTTPDDEFAPCDVVEVSDTGSGVSCHPSPNSLQLGDSGEVTWTDLDVPPEEKDSVNWDGENINPFTGQAIYDTETPGTYGATLYTNTESSGVACEPLTIGIIPIDYSAKLLGGRPGQTPKDIEVAINQGDDIDLSWEIAGFAPESCEITSDNASVGTQALTSSPVQIPDLMTSTLFTLSCRYTDESFVSHDEQDSFRVRVSGGGDTEEF